ncbi:MAG: sortase [Actinomycetales bacterium]|nr:sortase [Actinomycetales bacterium]
MSRIRPAVVIFWASMAVIVGSLLYIGAMQWQASEQAAEVNAGVRPTFSHSPSPSPTPSQVPSASPSATPSPSQPQLVAAPKRVRIPAIGVDTKIFPVGLDKNRAIEIPEDIRYVGWYELGVPPGVDRGSAVLVAHRDGVVQGHGVFYDLGNLSPGDKVFVTTSAGEDLPYKVVSREFIKKKSLPYEELFAVDGDPRLTLISCGGYYDRNNGGYQDNVVVTAVPLFTPIPTEPINGSVTPSATMSAAPSPASTSSPAAVDATPASVFVPEAGTVAQDSVPVLLDGSSLR